MRMNGKVWSAFLYDSLGLTENISFENEGAYLIGSWLKELLQEQDLGLSGQALDFSGQRQYAWNVKSNARFRLLKCSIDI